MAKIIKRKRKLRIEALVSLFFVFSIFTYLGCMTGLRSYNYVLSETAEHTDFEKEQLEDQVKTLETAVKEISNYDHIAQIAEKDGIRANQSNVKILSGE